MGIITKQGIYTSGISYLGAILGFITTLWLYPNILDPDQIGLIRTLVAIGVIVVQFTTLGTNSSIVRFFPIFRDYSRNHNGFLFWILLVPSVGLLLFSILFWGYPDYFFSLFKNNSPDIIFYKTELFVLIIFLLLFSVFSNYLRGLLKTIFSSFLQDFLLRLLIITCLLLLLFDVISFSLFILLFIASYAAISLCAIAYSLYLGNVSLSPNLDFFSKKLSKEILSFSAYSLLGNMATFMVGRIDIIMLSILINLTETGVYSIAFYIGGVIAIPLRSLNKISYPIIREAFIEHNVDEIEMIYKKTSLNQLIIGLLFYIGVCANLHNLMSILPEEFRGSELVIICIGAANLIDMMTGANGLIILSSKYYRVDLIMNVLLLGLTILLNLMLIPDMGMLGAAIATTASILIYNTAKLAFLWIRMDIQPFSVQSVYVVLSGSVIFFLAYLIIPIINNTFADILLRSFFILIAYILFIYRFKLSEDINRIIDKTLYHLKARLR